MNKLIKEIKNRPLLVQPTAAQEYITRISSFEIPLDKRLDSMSEMLESIFGPRPTLQKFPPYAVIPIQGLIGKGLPEIDKMCGACDVDDVSEMLEECERDESIKAIIFNINSPGGSHTGVPELANEIKECSKKTIAFTSTEACSAAYWLGSQCEEFYATKSATVGSVGCYMLFENTYQNLANDGVFMQVIRSGALKGAAIPGTNLTDAQLEMLQKHCDEVWTDFKESVKSVRSFVTDDAMEGQTFSGANAAKNGMVTGLVQGFDDLMEKLDEFVAEQMEAAEDNAQDNEESEHGIMEKSAAHRALGVDLAKSLAIFASTKKKKIKKSKVENEVEDEDEDEEMEDEDHEDDDDDDDREERDEVSNKKMETEDEEEDEDEAGEAQSPVSEEESDEDEIDEDVEDELEDAEKAIETDKKHSRKGMKRLKGKRA